METVFHDVPRDTESSQTVVSQSEGIVLILSMEMGLHPAHSQSMEEDGGGEIRALASPKDN